MTTTVTSVLVADLGVEGERMPVYAHVVDHLDARVLVDTGIKELHPLTTDLDPRIRPPKEWGLDIATIDIVVNTHLHFDHCGGNHLFAATPIYVQRRELGEGFAGRRELRPGDGHGAAVVAKAGQPPPAAVP